MSFKMHDPENYTISVKKEMYESEVLWVARVAELPDILEFGDSREDAYTSALYTIKVGQEMCAQDGTVFPSPSPSSYEDPYPSQQITLSLKTDTIHQVARIAESEGVSFDSYLSSSIDKYITLNIDHSSTSSFFSHILDNKDEKCLSLQKTLQNKISNTIFSIRKELSKQIIFRTAYEEELQSEDVSQLVKIKINTPTRMGLI